MAFAYDDSTEINHTTHVERQDLVKSDHISHTTGTGMYTDLVTSLNSESATDCFSGKGTGSEI